MTAAPSLLEVASDFQFGARVRTKSFAIERKGRAQLVSVPRSAKMPGRLHRFAATVRATTPRHAAKI